MLDALGGIQVARSPQRIHLHARVPTRARMIRWTRTGNWIRIRNPSQKPNFRQDLRASGVKRFEPYVPQGEIDLRCPRLRRSASPLDDLHVSVTGPAGLKADDLNPKSRDVCSQPSVCLTDNLPKPKGNPQKPSKRALCQTPLQHLRWWDRMCWIWSSDCRPGVSVVAKLGASMLGEFTSGQKSEEDELEGILVQTTSARQLSKTLDS